LAGYNQKIHKYLLNGVLTHVGSINSLANIKTMFKKVNAQVKFPKLEENILKNWQDNGIIKRALQANQDGPDFVFFEGPPTANGKPGIHHVLARVFKDLIPRYKRMNGFHLIGTRGGWDTQGLPVEVAVEKALNLSGKQDIEKYGIAEFNKKCRDSVFIYVQDWEKLTDRIAYWVDMEDAYITYKNNYIESCWWILKNFWKNGLLFKDYKVNMHCPRCVTTLADQEVAQGYKENTDDPSVWPKFKALDFENVLSGLPTENTYFLAWTTTPWTLPANVAIAVKPDGEYVAVRNGDDVLILAKELLGKNIAQKQDEEENLLDYEILKSFMGSELAGLKYGNLYSGHVPAGDEINEEKLYRVIADDYVSLGDGTGIVHIAPAYGDLEIGRRHDLPMLFSCDLQGKMYANILDEITGIFFKDADKNIMRNLKTRNLLYKDGRTKHTYPFCWRCDAPLLFYAKSSWYIRTTEKKDKLVEGNKQINWVPSHIKEGRFGNWLENNIDWAISRQRYWGTPLPVWECKCGHQECIGSVEELSQKAGKDLAELDLHRPYVDEISWACECCGLPMNRVPDLMDVWFDSGSMPVAQWHYPFQNEDMYARGKQADFICEAIDQTRGWFYTLHAVSTMLNDSPAFKNVICLGHILDKNGEKMSKSKGNIVEPWAVLDAHGSDALRWYLYTCTAPGNPRRFSEDLVGETVRQFLLTLWNTYSFFVTYANLDGYVASEDTGELTLIDKWALSRLQNLIKVVSDYLDEYNVIDAAKEIEKFVDDLSNWYLRRNRRRFWKSEADKDKQAAYYTLHRCLVTVSELLAPFTPYIADEIYSNLMNLSENDSVHLKNWPKIDESLIDNRLDEDMAVLLRVVELGRSARNDSGIKIRQPLGEMLVLLPTVEGEKGLMRFVDEALEELNIKSINFIKDDAEMVNYSFKPNLPVIGKKYGQLIPKIKQALSILSADKAKQIALKAKGGESFEITLEDGTKMEFTSEEVLIETSSAEGYSVAVDGGYVAALNTTITAELKAEGIARDAVRAIQDTRKEAGFEISDHIKLCIASENSEIISALNSHNGYITTETLTDEIIIEEGQKGSVEITLSDERVYITIIKI